VGGGGLRTAVSAGMSTERKRREPPISARALRVGEMHIRSTHARIAHKSVRIERALARDQIPGRCTRPGRPPQAAPHTFDLLIKYYTTSKNE
jgi:hypothetical protein